MSICANLKALIAPYPLAQEGRVNCAIRQGKGGKGMPFAFRRKRLLYSIAKNGQSKLASYLKLVSKRLKQNRRV